MRPARSDRQFPDVRKLECGLAEGGIAAVGRVLQEGDVAAKARRGDRQGSLGDEGLRAVDLFVEVEQARHPLERRTVIGCQPELLAELGGRLVRPIIDEQREGRKG